MKVTTLPKMFCAALLRVSLFSMLLLLFNSCGSDEGSDAQIDMPTQAPTISSIDPTTGPVGTEVIITGSNFSDSPSQNSVEFNGTSASIKSASTTTLVVDVPDGTTTGAVSVTVEEQTATGPTFTVTVEEPATAIEIDCDANEITSSTVWPDVESGNAVDYIVRCAISIKNNALLTIAPGVIIQFEGEEAGIFTSDGGGLSAVGTVNEPIIFEGTSDLQGVWQGIYFASTNPLNTLDYVEVRNAGRNASQQSGVKAGVQLSEKDDSRASITNTTIENNEGYGIYITEDSNLENFSTNTINNNSLSPVGINFNQIGKLDASSTYGTGNGQAFIEVIRDELTVDADVAALDMPFRFTESDKYYLEKALNIAPGTIFEFVNGAGLKLGRPLANECSIATGSINATGTANDPIIFRGTVNGTGSWLGIGFNSSSPNNKLIYCQISGAGSDKMFNGADFGANITLACDSKVIIQNTTIAESKEYGIYMFDEDAILQDFESNSFTANETAPIYIDFPHIGELDSDSDYDTNDSGAFIHVSGERLKDNDLTVQALNVPYRIFPSELGLPVLVEKEIFISPGVIFEFNAGTGIELGTLGTDCGITSGSLNAIGTSEEPIIFRGVVEGQGTWIGIGINSSTAANELDYCEISGGGSQQLYNAGGQGNIVIHCSGKLKIQNSTIKDSGGWGIDFVQTSPNNLDANNISYENNSAGNVNN
ncbi:MAG: IPT/TIG domain-containing protein [Bacteroidota bacterium]